MAFLVAGGLFALLPAASVLNAVAGTEIAVSPAVIFVYLLVVFVGLLGLYPRLAELDTRLSRAGIGLLAVTTAILIPTVAMYLIWTAPPFGETGALAIVIAVVVGSTLTVVTFGIASLRTGAYSRPVGGFLLVIAASMSLMILMMLAYGHSTPEWMGDVVNGLVATSLGSIGYVLRTGDVPGETAETSRDVAAG